MQIMKALILSHSASLTGFGQWVKSFFLTQKVTNPNSGSGHDWGDWSLDAATDN